MATAVMNKSKLISIRSVFYLFVGMGFSNIASANCWNWEELDYVGAPTSEICLDGKCYIARQWFECTGRTWAGAGFDVPDHSVDFHVGCTVKTYGSGYDQYSQADQCKIEFSGKWLTDQQLSTLTCKDLDEGGRSCNWLK
jgi:hypothetical protein